MCVSIFLLLNKKTSGPSCSELTVDDDCQDCEDRSFGGEITPLQDDIPCQNNTGTCQSGTCEGGK